MGLLDFLSQGNSKDILGISVTPGVGLELTVYDAHTSTIKNYGRKSLEYDFSKREIHDLGQFKIEFSDLVAQMEISPKSMPAYLILPTVLFDFHEVPKDLPAKDIEALILSEAEDFFIFKRERPVSGFCEVINTANEEMKRVAYSSFQENIINELKEIIASCGFDLIGIDNSYAATLRGLYATEKINDVIFDNASWAAMLVNTNSFTIFKMQGKNLLNFVDVPIAVRTFSPEEIYDAIISSASQVLSEFDASKLFIISQIDEISAEIVKRKMQFNKEIVAINTNKYAESIPLLDVRKAVDFNEANSMTLAAIGSSCIKTELGLVMNVLGSDTSASLGVYFVTEIAGQQVEVTKTLVQSLATLLIVLLLIVFGTVYGIIAFLNKQTEDSLSKIKSELEQVTNQISAESEKGNKQEVDMMSIIDDIANENVSAISFYDSIATDIPKKVWLTVYYNREGSKIAVKGISESIVDIYEYYKNLRIVSPQSDIRLNELKVFTNGDSSATDNNNPQESASKATNNLVINPSDRLYTFEISNTQIMSSGEGGNPTDPNQNNDGAQNNNQQKLTQNSSFQMSDIEKTSLQMKLAN